MPVAPILLGGGVLFLTIGGLIAVVTKKAFKIKPDEYVASRRTMSMEKTGKTQETKKNTG